MMLQQSGYNVIKACSGSEGIKKFTEHKKAISLVLADVIMPTMSGPDPSTWLYTIARNTCLSALRSEAHRKTSPLDSIPEPAAAGTTGGSDALNRIELQRCLERLPQIQRDVITLFYLQEKSVEEVARMLDLPEGTVKSHLHRARLALAARMKE